MVNEHKVIRFNLGEKVSTGDISDTLDRYSKEGWELVSIIPITTGRHQMEMFNDGGAGWGYGYTSWLMITFSRQSTD